MEEMAGGTPRSMRKTVSKPRCNHKETGCNQNLLYCV
jgi:hypothetical protein